MTLENFEVCLRAYAKRRPFKPFLIDFMNGPTAKVTHPEAIRIRKRVIHFTTPSNEHHLFDGDSVCRFRDESETDLPQ